MIVIYININTKRLKTRRLVLLVQEDCQGSRDQ